jgi:diacylglycerol kinase (ATP)
MKTREFSFRGRAGSFRFAFNGVKQFFQREHNARIHFLFSVSVFVAAWWFRLSRNEIICLVIVTGGVWITEIMNTVIERIMDFISPERHPEIKYIKDLSAAAVLIASFIALGTGSLIFIPKIF